MTVQELFYNDLLTIAAKIIPAAQIIPITMAIKKKKYINNCLSILLKHLIFLFFISLLMYLYICAVNSSTYYFFLKPILDYLKIDSTNFFSIFSFLNYFILLGAYFSDEFPKVKFQPYIKPLSWFLLAIVTVDYFFVTGYNNYSSFSQTLWAFYTLLLPMAHLWYIYRTPSKVPLNRNPYFWIAMGLVLPSILTVWLELYGSRLYSSNFVLFCQVSIGNCFFYCIGQVLIAIGFYYARYVRYLPS